MFESFLGVNPWTALFILLNTLTIFFVAKKFLFGPVMKIIADRPVPWTVDGEYGGTRSEVEISNHKQALRVLVPERSVKLQELKRELEQEQ